MVIKDWKFLYGILLLILPHFINKHLLVITGSIFLTLAGCWLLADCYQDYKISRNKK